MLENLPTEVIDHIVGHLPTASSVVNLSGASRKLHSIISAHDYNVFRTFVQRAFPTINTPPLWRDAARTLTTRSRAWDRRAFIVRECCPPPEPEDHQWNGLHSHSMGYQPSIDSYETWQGGSWSSRKQVLAWGAGGRLRIRTIQDNMPTWSSYRIPDDHTQPLDILDVQILRPHQRQTLEGESIVFRRANGEIIHVETSEPGVFTERSRHRVLGSECFGMDVSPGADPLMALCRDRYVSLHPVHEPGEITHPAQPTELKDPPQNPLRMLYAKFLSESTLAVSHQYSPWRPNNGDIGIYDIAPTGLSSEPLTKLMKPPETALPPVSGNSARVIEPLDDGVGPSQGHSGRLFLSGWTDGIARLYDTRVPQAPVADYVDSVDDGFILSLLAIGHERFLAGSSQNGCLRTYDFRMPGARPYSYQDVRRQNSKQNAAKSNPQRDFNIFLTPMMNYREQMWKPLPRRPQKSARRYRGSVYSLSSPSPSSPTVYAGIENHVLQLDFVPTDDVRSHRLPPGLVDADYELCADEAADVQKTILDFSCYERPRQGRESTDPILLRKQRDFSKALLYEMPSYDDKSKELGWDERLTLDMNIENPWQRRDRWRNSRRQS